MDKESEEDIYAEMARFWTKPPAHTPGPELTLDTLQAAVEELKQAEQNKRAFSGMELVDSRYIPNGVSVLRNEKQFAIVNHETRKIMVADMQDFLSALPEIKIEPAVIDAAHRIWAEKYSPVLFRPHSVLAIINHDDFHAEAYRVLIPQQVKDSARCRQRHYRARRQGRKSR